MNIHLLLPFRLEDQFDIDAEFEQFQNEESMYYDYPYFMGEEGEEGGVEEGGEDERSPDQ